MSSESEQGQRIQFVLIDFENVHPESIKSLMGGEYRVIVFSGANQRSVPFGLAETMQQLGSHGEYVKISGNGRNALDFHIAFYIGRLSAKTPHSYFHIISKDKGFDPLVTHLRKAGIPAGRIECISKIPKPHHEMSKSEKFAAVVEKLASLKDSKPKSLNALEATVGSTFHGKLPPEEVKALVQSLRSRKHVEVDNGKILYRLK